MNKYLKGLIRAATAQGWRIERARHLKWFSPDGRALIVTGCTESDSRAYKNTLARLKRAGFHE